MVVVLESVYEYEAIKSKKQTKNFIVPSQTAISLVYFDLNCSSDLFKNVAYCRLQFDSFDPEYICVTYLLQCLG